MSPSFMKKTMVYLGLLDDEYDEYDDLEDRAPQGFTSATRVEPRPRSYDQRRGVQRRHDQGPHHPPRIGRPEPAAVQPEPVAPRPRRCGRCRSTRRISPAGRRRPRPRCTWSRRSRFGDAKEIADRLKDNRPVIVNLQVADRDLQRRMIDFCSGVTYALSGEMEKVADQVFLLAPTNVKVSDEERQRLVERGFGRD